jgi:hypothetical protein
MENTAYIESYFRNELSADEKRQFEQKIIVDKDFAEEVAFYYGVSQAAKNEAHAEKKKRFGEIYQQAAPSQKPGIVQKLKFYSAAAAAIAAIMISLYLFTRPVSSKELANEYIQQHFQTLGVTMSSGQDSIQRALSLYNDGKLPEALEQFEKIVRSGGAGNFDAKKYAGIVSLKMNHYDKSLTYFTQIENDSGFSNPGKLYKAITLLERNNPGDLGLAKILLQQIVRENLEGKETAEEWLKKKW